MDLESKLKKWWAKVSESKMRFSRAEGEKESILRRLKEEEGLSGVEEARKHVKRQERKKEDLADELDGVLHTLKEDFGFE